MKILFFDIDGTLVSFRNHLIPQSAVDAIASAKAKGHKIIISTGRPQAFIDNLSQIESKGCVDGYITMNGAYTFVGNQVISAHPIPNEDARDIIMYCREAGVATIYVSEKDIWLYRPSLLYQSIFNDQLQIKVNPTHSTLDEMELAHKNLYQITPFLNVSQEQELSSRLEGSEMARWHPDFLDIMGAGNTKRKGVEAVCRYFHADISDTIAFGDGGNDIPMLKYAGTGVAMGNASDEVKRVADYIAPHIEEDGLSKIMRELGLCD